MPQGRSPQAMPLSASIVATHSGTSSRLHWPSSSWFPSSPSAWGASIPAATKPAASLLLRLSTRTGRPRRARAWAIARPIRPPPRIVIGELMATGTGRWDQARIHGHAP